MGLSSAFAQRLPIRQYGVADGLVQNQVSAILHDRRGFLWFGTFEGLSRFDGKRFVNYGLDQGLPHPVVTSLAEDPAGRLWVGTNGGLATLVDEVDPAPPATPGSRSSFRVHELGPGQDREVIAVLFDGAGRPWCLTYSGLWRGREERHRVWTFEGVLSRSTRADWTQAALVDGQGRLWFGLVDTLVSVSQGQVQSYWPPAGLRSRDILSILERAPGRILVAFKHDLLEFATSSGNWTSVELDLGQNSLTGPLAQSSRGVLFVGTLHGLLRLAGKDRRLYTTAQGLAEDHVGALALDRQGDLWIGHGPKGSRLGLSRLQENGIQSWTLRDGVPEATVLRIISAADGRIYASTENAGLFEITGDGIRPVAGSQSPLFRNVRRRVVQDSRGDWWIGTEQGLFRFEGPRLRLEGKRRRFTREDGFTDAAVNAHAVYADPAGPVWVGSTDGYVYRFDPGRRQAPLFDRFAVDPRERDRSIRKFVMDRTGTLWMASFTGLARLHQQRISEVRPTENLPDVWVRSFLQDGKGRLWVGLRYHGLSVTEDPQATTPLWTNYSTRNGLASNAVWCLAEDARGRIYIGTSRGLDRLDPATGHLRHFSTGDGLPGDVVNDCTMDPDGHLWLALQGGVARLDPEALSTVPEAAAVYLTRVAVAGVNVPLPERGAAQVSGLEIPAAHNSLVIDYVAPTLGEASYQYRLEGVDRDWSPPSTSSSVQYARLEPGRYRFLVRTVPAEGVIGAEARLEFGVEPPFWRRTWFLAVVGAAVVSAAFGVHRLRVGRAMALQRVRSQIASDLHDELGSGLGSIGILAGLSAEGKLVEGEQRGLAGRIADTAAELGSMLSDIVWALRSDTASPEALASHLAERATRLFPLPPPEFETRFPAQWPEVQLPLVVRRSLLLIALEALHNAARHAQARRVTLGLALEGSRLRLWVEDDGRGFSPQLLSDADRGMGLANMRRRAAEAKAQIAFTPRPGGGTVLEVSLNVRLPSALLSGRRP